MRLFKGWKLTLMASMALAGSSGQGMAQKPGSWGTNKSPASGGQVAMPVSYVEQDAPVTGLPLGGIPAEAYSVGGVPVGTLPASMNPAMEGVPMVGADPMMGGHLVVLSP